MNENDVIQQVEAYLHDLRHRAQVAEQRAAYCAAFAEAVAQVPTLLAAIDDVARRTALAIEAGVLSVEAIARLRSALAFADAADRAGYRAGD